MFGKVFKQIYASSIARDYKVRHVFMDLIVLADSDGVVDMTHESIAATTGVPMEDLRAALEILLKPDPQSRSKEESGARLVPLTIDRNWGWQIVNYVKYRLIACETERREKTRIRTRKWRDKKHLQNGDAPVTHGDACDAREKKREMEKDKKKKNEEAFNINKGFRKPTLEEISLKASEIGLQALEAERFFNYYESNGWKVGRVAMKDWVASLRNWKPSFIAPKKPESKQRDEQLTAPRL